MPEPGKAVLSHIEAQSAFWQKIKAHLDERLQRLREKNDGNLDERRTAELRGAIREIKNLAALDKPAPSVDATDFE